MPKPSEPSELMTSSEVAALFRVGRETVTKWVRTGVLDAVSTPGGRYRFRTSDVRELLARRDEFGMIPDAQPPNSQAPGAVPGTAAGAPPHGGRGPAPTENS